MLMEIQERFFVTITVSISGSSAMELSLMYSASGKQEDAALINRIEVSLLPRTETVLVIKKSVLKRWFTLGMIILKKLLMKHWPVLKSLFQMKTSASGRKKNLSRARRVQVVYKILIIMIICVV